MPKRQVWKRGSVVRIPLGTGACAYGQMLDSPEYAFFELRDSGETDPEVVAQQDVIFRLWVMRTAHGSRRWTKVGDAPLQVGLQRPVPRFNEDAISKQIRLGEDGITGKVVTPEECEGFERAAVWDASHVEDRLRDHFAGRPNKWVESMRPHEAGVSPASAAQPAVAADGASPRR